MSKKPLEIEEVLPNSLSRWTDDDGVSYLSFKASNIEGTIRNFEITVSALHALQARETLWQSLQALDAASAQCHPFTER